MQWIIGFALVSIGLSGNGTLLYSPQADIMIAFAGALLINGASTALVRAHCHWWSMPCTHTLVWQ